MNFNRRQNRIASPGFHINVRYDDQTMARAHTNSNNASSHVQKGTAHLENFDVKEGEILVTKKDSGMYHDGYTHCFSFANGFPDSKKASDQSPAGVAEYILQQVKYVGIATTEYKPSKAYSEQGHVAQVGGVVTLINEGEDIIKPGDKLAIGLNLNIGRKTTRDKGIPRDKIRFCVVKAKHSDAMIAEALKESQLSQQEVADYTKAVDDSLGVLSKKSTPAEKAAAKKDLADAKTKLNACFSGSQMTSFLQKYQQLHERIIGKSASYARPGDRLEVVLQPRNPY